MPDLRPLPRRAAALAFCTGLLALAPALAAGGAAQFPPASRVGIAPPRDMVLSKRFTGFENPAKGAAVTFVEMPAEAYPQVAAGLTPEALRAQGFAVKSREEVKLVGRDALILAGEQSAGPLTVRKWLVLVQDPTLTAFVIVQAAVGGAAGGAADSTYGADEMRAALDTIALRPPVPVEEQIAALPFRVGERAGFRPVRVMAGNALLLTDGPNDAVKENEQPILILAQAVAPAPTPEQRPAFARSALFSNGFLKDVLVERSQGYRQHGADWHETVARATDKETGRPVVVVQTIRFAPEGYLRMVGITRAEAREAHLPRFRAVTDSVEAN